MLQESAGVRLRTDSESYPIRTNYSAAVSFNSEVYSVYRRQTPVQYLIKHFKHILRGKFIFAGIPQPSTQYRTTSTTEPSISPEKGEWEFYVTDTDHSPTDSRLLKLWLQFTLKLDCCYMFRSTNIIWELETEPG